MKEKKNGKNGGENEKNKMKKSSSWPFLAHSGAGQETTFYLRAP